MPDITTILVPGSDVNMAELRDYLHESTAFVPDQTDFEGTIALGERLTTLVHATGIEGQFNTFFGFGSGVGITNQWSNVGIGYNACRFQAEGVHPDTGTGVFGNVAVGDSAMSVLLHAFDNTAVGTQAGMNFKNGDDNCFFGIKAGMSLRVGSDNTLLGYGAGENLGNNEDDCDANVMVGPQAGRSISDLATPLLIAQRCVLIGDRASPLADNTSNEIVIGATALGHGENTVTLGNDDITATYLKGSVTVPGDIKAISDTFRQFILEREGFGSWTLGNGVVDSVSNNFSIAVNGTVVLIVDTDGVLTPGADGTQNLGADALRFDTGFFETVDAGTEVVVGGTKVVGAQGAAVADATDAASAITQLNALLARMRAHGLIAA